MTSLVMAANAQVPTSEPWSATATAWATIVSVAILFSGFIVAWRQLVSLNKATQLENFITLSQELESATFIAALDAVATLTYDPKTDDLKAGHQEWNSVQRVTNYFERIGTLVHRRYLDQSLAIYWWGGIAQGQYQHLSDWIHSEQRRNPDYCVEFQRFVRLADKEQQGGRNSTEPHQAKSQSGRATEQKPKPTL